MWQRIQTVYLLLAVLATMACACLPIAEVVPTKMEPNTIVTNIGIITPDEGTIPFTVPILFVLLILSSAIAATAIFSFKRRKRQARICVWAVVCNVLWYISFVTLYVYGQFSESDDQTMNASYPIALPLIAIILLFMARRSILKDEALVRAADRIR